jgi:hypothetical protein
LNLEGCKRRLFASLVALLLASTTGARADDESFAVTGNWQLESKENFDTYLKESGAPWWKRRLAQLGSARIRQTISRRGDRVSVETENPLRTRTEVFIVDGRTPVRYEIASGDVMEWIARVEGDAFVIEGHGDLGHRIVRREVVEGRMVMTLINPDANVECRLIHQRVDAE